MQLKPKLIAAFAAVTLVVACGGGAGIPDGIASFGDAFVSMFSAPSNAEPVDAQSVPLTVSFTTDPFNP